MKTSKLLARAALPAGAAILSLSAWAVAASAVPVPASAPLQLVAPAADSTVSVAPPVVAEEPVLAPQIGNMKYGCRRRAPVDSVGAVAVAAPITSEAAGGTR